MAALMAARKSNGPESAGAKGMVAQSKGVEGIGVEENNGVESVGAKRMVAENNGVEGFVVVNRSVEGIAVENSGREGIVAMSKGARGIVAKSGNVKSRGLHSKDWASKVGGSRAKESRGVEADKDWKDLLRKRRDALDEAERM